MLHIELGLYQLDNTEGPSSSPNFLKFIIYFHGFSIIEITKSLPLSDKELDSVSKNKHVYTLKKLKCFRDI